MVYLEKELKNMICEKVKKIRIERFGEGRGAQRRIAQKLGIPYTTYRGYESNRFNIGFLILFSKKLNVSLSWILSPKEEYEREKKESEIKKEKSQVIIIPNKDIIIAPQFTVVQVQGKFMTPTLQEGTWVGIQEKLFTEELNGKIVGIRKYDQILVRRIIIRDKIILAIADNPANSRDSISVNREEVLGEVAWSWQKF